MGIELTLLIPVIVLFIISFCGLLKKIRKSYEAERIIDGKSYIILIKEIRKMWVLDRNVGTLSNISIPEIYVNQSFSRESENSTSESVFPGAPPPYSGK